jgi:hypothetical protein
VEQHLGYSTAVGRAFLKDWHRDLFEFKHRRISLACDTSADIPWMEKLVESLRGFLSEAALLHDDRLSRRIDELGFMLSRSFTKPETTRVYPEEWPKGSRKWSRPAAYMGNSL